MNKKFVNPVLLNELKKRVGFDVLNAGIKTFLKALRNPIKFFVDWKESIQSLIDMVVQVVVTVEEMQKEFQTMILGGKEKMMLASKFLDDLIRFPVIIELVDDKIFYMLISMVCSFKNKTEGHKWNT